MAAVLGLVAEGEAHGRGGGAGGGGCAGKHDGRAGRGEAEIGEGLIGGGEVAGAEAGVVLKELELVDEAGDGVRVGGPLVGLGHPPGFAAALEGEGAGGGGNLERADVGGFGTEHAAAGFLPVFLGAPAAFEAENKEEEDDVEEEEGEGDFGAHRERGVGGGASGGESSKRRSRGAP